MSDCCNKNGLTSKKGFGKGSHSSAAMDKKIVNAYSQLSVKIAKLKKASKKLVKVSKKCKHKLKNDSDDSDSS